MKEERKKKKKGEKKRPGAEGTGYSILRHPEIESGALAWEASMLPLHQWRTVNTLERIPGLTPGPWLSNEWGTFARLGALFHETAPRASLYMYSVRTIRSIARSPFTSLPSSLLAGASSGFPPAQGTQRNY